MKIADSNFNFTKNLPSSNYDLKHKSLTNYEETRKTYFNLINAFFRFFLVKIADEKGIHSTLNKYDNFKLFL